MPQGTAFVGNNNLTSDTDESIQVIYEYKNEEIFDKTKRKKRRNTKFENGFKSETEELLLKQ